MSLSKIWRTFPAAGRSPTRPPLPRPNSPSSVVAQRPRPFPGDLTYWRSATGARRRPCRVVGVARSPIGVFALSGVQARSRILFDDGHPQLGTTDGGKTMEMIDSKVWTGVQSLLDNYLKISA